MDIRQFAYAGIDIYGLLADYTGKATQEVKEMEISYEVLNGALQRAGQEGGKYFGAMEKSSTTLAGQTNKLKADFQNLIMELTVELLPVAKQVIQYIRDGIKWIKNLSPEMKKNIKQWALIVGAIGPVLKVFGKLTTGIGSVVKTIGTFSTAIGVVKTGVESTNKAANSLAKGISTAINPAFLGVAATIGIVVGALTIFKKNTEEAQKHAVETGTKMAEGIQGYIDGITNAESQLGAFNDQLFVSAERQQELQTGIETAQNGITEIIRTATEERRDYTDEEIESLNNYFETIKGFNDELVGYQEEKSKAILQVAKTELETFKGNEAEYEVLSQKWIKTIQEQRDQTVATIEEQTTTEIALLNKRYGEEANLSNEAYATEYNEIMRRKEEKIANANDEVTAITSIYGEGYLKQEESMNTAFANEIGMRDKQKQSVLDIIKQAGEEEEQLRNHYNELVKTGLKSREQAEKEFQLESGKLWNKVSSNLDESQKKQLGTFLAMQVMTETEGGKLTEENRKVATNILKMYDSLPEDTKNKFKDTMQGAIDGVREKQGGLFDIARRTANSFTSIFAKTLDIHSPSKVFKKLFAYTMEGAELGIEEEENSLYKKAEEVAEKFKNTFVDMGLVQSKVNASQKTIFTTPQIVFNVQELDDEKLNQCFNYINRKFGSAY